MFRYLLLDLDNTLYPSDCGLWEAIGHRINLFMIERLGMDPDEVSEKRDTYLHRFGTTLSALSHYHSVDPDEFLAFVHDLPLGQYLHVEPALDDMFSRLPQRKVVFTNADEPHARRVLECLGIARHFDHIVDILALEFVNKPDPRAYRRALEFLGALPEECLFVDDSLQNLLPARAMGMTTVLVGEGCPSTGVDHCIARIIELEEILGGGQ